MSATVRFEGTTLTLGGDDFIVPPLSLKQVRALANDIAHLSGLIATGGPVPVAALDSLEKIVQTALSRNYPDLTLDKVQDILDLGNMRKAITAVLGISGLENGSGKAAAATSTGA